MAPTGPEFQLLSIRVAARRLGVSPRTLRRRMQTWGLPRIRLGRRVLVDERDLRALIERARNAKV